MKVIAFVGWEEGHPEHEGAIRDALEGSKVMFLSDSEDVGALKTTLASAIERDPETKRLAPKNTSFYILDGVGNTARKVVGVLEKKGAEVVAGSYEIPNWDIEPTADIVDSWLEFGKWLEPEPELSLEDELFGDSDLDSLFDDEEDSDVDDQLSVRDDDIPDDVEDIDDELLGGSDLDNLALSMRDNEDVDEDSEPAREERSSSRKPSAEAVRRANDIYRSQRRDESRDDGMQRVARHDEAVGAGNQDIPISFVERDGDIRGVEGGLKKEEPRASSDSDGRSSEKVSVVEADDSEDDDDNPIIDIDSSLPDEDVADIDVERDRPEELAYTSDISIEEVRDEDEDVRALRVDAERKRTMRAQEVKGVSNVEGYRSRKNDLGDAITYADFDDNSDRRLNAQREAEGRVPPYMKSLPNDAARREQAQREDMGALQYASGTMANPDSLLVMVTGTSGGVGKTLVSYSLASTAARGLAFLRKHKATTDQRPVYLVECDWENPDLEGLLGSTKDSDGRDIERSVNTMMPIIEEHIQRNLNVDLERVTELLDSCTTVDKQSGLCIIPAPYNLRHSNDYKKPLVYSINQIVLALLSMPGGAIVFLDCPNLAAPRNSPLMRSILESYDPEVVLVTVAHKEKEAGRAYELLSNSAKSDITVGRKDKSAPGYGVGRDRIWTVLNSADKDNVDEDRELFISKTGHAVNAIIPELDRLRRKGWVGELSKGKITREQREREVYEQQVLTTSSIRFLSGTSGILPDLQGLMPSTKRRTVQKENGMWTRLKRAVGLSA